MQLVPSAPIVAVEPADVPADLLESCAQEPIRIPGSVQRHGFLLGLDAHHERVVLASENAEEFLGVPLKLILGGELDLLFERELLAAIRQMSCAIDPEGLVSYLGAYQVRRDLFSVVTHCIEGTRILEFERQDRLVGAEMMNAVITNFVGTLARLNSQQELCQAFTDQFAALTGFDRVLLYCFDEEGHGTVLTEANSGRLPSYLDLRFPATDIPAQARELYVLNTVRIIPNATYTPSPIQRMSEEGPRTLDLSLSVLRSVSPVHLEYMRNMGTLSSMSVSIVVEGKLWGLISGHHAEPRTIPYLVRSACDMLSKMVGTQLNTFRTSERLRTLVDFHAVQRELLTAIASESDYTAALALQAERVMQVTHAKGAIVWDNGTIYRAGRTPANEVLSDVVDWLDGMEEFETYSTRTLSLVCPAAGEGAIADGSGLLAIRLSESTQRYILWFKPEVLETVTWAGEPIKRIDANERLHPRKSFASWQETFRGQSEHWTSVEEESAREFRSALVTISLQRAEEEAELSSARFLQLTHNLPTMVFTCDNSAQLTYVNERWREQGLSDRGIWFDGGRLNAEDEARIQETWEHIVAEDGSIETEVRLRIGGGERWSLVRVTPFRRVGKRPAGWVGILLDLTERRQREEALRMTEKLALSGRMTSVIAHEINNPLESITNLMYLLRQEAGTQGNAGEYIGMVEAELERISGITKQTLRWNRESRATAEDITAASLFEEVTRLLQGKTRNRMVAVHRRYDPEVQVHGVVGQLRQVIVNLFSNALDAARVGGNVTLNAFYEGEDTVLSVADDGVGMPQSMLRQLFQPFFSTKGDLGNGLGLYISHEIIERHHGKFEIDSVEGKGTTVSVRLPRFPSAPVVNHPE